MQKAVVQRVDDQLGVLLSLPGYCNGYAHISDISDERVNNLPKVLQIGQAESARVIGSRPMDGLAVVSLKPSAIEQYLLVSDRQPGISQLFLSLSRQVRNLECLSGDTNFHF